MGRYKCGHCNQVLSKTAFHQHKRLYYYRLSKKWSSTRVNYSGSEADGPSSIPFSISSSESENDDYDHQFLVEEQQFSPCVETLSGELGIYI